MLTFGKHVVLPPSSSDTSLIFWPVRLGCQLMVNVCGNFGKHFSFSTRPSVRIPKSTDEKHLFSAYFYLPVTAIWKQCWVMSFPWRSFILAVLACVKVSPYPFMFIHPTIVIKPLTITHIQSKRETPVLRRFYSCFGCEDKTGVLRSLVISQDAPLFSHIIQKVLTRSFHWFGWTKVYPE